MMMGWDCKAAGHDTAKGQGMHAWKGKHRRADRPTLMENKKAFSLLLMPTTTYGNYLELLPYTYMYYDYLIYLRF